MFVVKDKYWLRFIEIVTSVNKILENLQLYYELTIRICNQVYWSYMNVHSIELVSTYFYFIFKCDAFSMILVDVECLLFSETKIVSCVYVIWVKYKRLYGIVKFEDAFIWRLPPYGHRKKVLAICGRVQSEAKAHRVHSERAVILDMTWHVVNFHTTACLTPF